MGPRTSDSRILNGQGSSGDIRGNSDKQRGLGGEELRVGEGAVTSLIQSIGRVGNELSQEDLWTEKDGQAPISHLLQRYQYYILPYLLVRVKGV